MRYLTLFLLLFSFNIYAQKSNVFIIDSLPQQGILLDKGWKWHAADNPDFAKADFDDSKWETIDPTRDIMDLPQIQDGKVSWIRLRIKMDTNLVSQSIGLGILQTIASEIYANGKLIKKYGNLNTKDKKAMYARNMIGFPKNNTDVLLAVRFAFQKSAIYNKYSSLPNDFFKAKLLPIEAINFRDFDWVMYGSLAFIKVGLFLLMFILHLAFFINYPLKKVNLYFSLMAFCFALHSLMWALYVVTPIVENLKFLMVMGILRMLIFPLIYIFLLKALYDIFNFKLNLLFWLVLSIDILLLFISLFSYKRGVTIIETPITQLNILVSIFITSKAIFANIKNSKIILVGMICSVACFAIRSLGFFEIITKSKITENLFDFIGVISIPLTISWFLGAEFAITNRNLSGKLKEVEALSREKQQILASQNETLEKQVEARTAELKASQTQLIQKEKLASLGELTAGIAHEIQNPLNFVNNFSEVSSELVTEMKEEMAIGNQLAANEIADDLKQNLEKITLHGKRASSIVKGMLEHSKASTGEKQLTDINALADEYLRLSYHGLRAKNKDFNSDFKTDFDTNLPKVNIIPQDMGRVLLNLINNAFYAAYESKKLNPLVTVSTKLIHSLEGQGWVSISVKDNGNGIPKANLAKIYQPFFTTKPTGQGTGLGLSLAYNIVTKGHGGTIEVVSKEGEGAEFIIKLAFV